jgi:hypothetical protein
MNAKVSQSAKADAEVENWLYSLRTLWFKRYSDEREEDAIRKS